MRPKFKGRSGQQWTGPRFFLNDLTKRNFQRNVLKKGKTEDRDLDLGYTSNYYLLDNE